MREETDAIRTHYNADPRKEWDRLMKKHPHEKYITIHIMDRYIQPGCSILDIGGGPLRKEESQAVRREDHRPAG